MDLSRESTIFDFTLPVSAESFAPIDDQVMGGISRSSFEESGRETAIFSGEVSFENYGGFASVRSAPGEYDLSRYTGLMMDLMGDGKSYKLSLTTDFPDGSITYRARFDTEPGKWKTVSIPFDQFIPTFRGNVVSGAPPLDSRSIRTFGFLISDRQEGEFRLELRWIKAYRE